MNTTIQRAIFALITVGLYVYVAIQSSAKAELILYKATLITIAAMLGYWIDLLLFKNFRPDDIRRNLEDDVSTIAQIDADKKDGKEIHWAAEDKVRGMFEYRKSIIGVSIIRRSIIIAACVLAISLGI